MTLAGLGASLLAQATSPTPLPQPPKDTPIGFYLFYFLSPFIAPAITVLLGGVFIQRAFVSRANASAFADALVKRMDDILTDSLEYWNTHNTEQGQEKRLVVLAQKIKGGVKILGSDLNHFKKKYAHNEDFDLALVSVADACTGGSFESSTRTADTQRYLLIVNTINDLKSKVLRIKL